MLYLIINTTEKFKDKQDRFLPSVNSLERSDTLVAHVDEEAFVYLMQFKVLHMDQNILTSTDRQYVSGTI